MYIDDYISTIDSEKTDLIASIKQVSNDIFSNIQNHFRSARQINGLIVGDVQSGKTGKMLGVISRMADNGYRLFILLTTDNIDLQRQTFRRVKDALPNFNVLSEKDEALFHPENLLKPYVIVLKKNAKVLKKWKNLIVSTEVCRGLFLCIFDDEADATSLNTKVNQGGISPINKTLSEIKDTAVATVYMEVTATPQAVLLQTENSGWQASFVNYFRPGNGYLGGNYFYTDPVSPCVRFTAEYEIEDVIGGDDLLCPEGLRNSLNSFLVVCAYKKIKGELNCNFLIHPSAQVYIHDKFVNRVQEELNLLTQSTLDEGFDDMLKEAWNDLFTTYSALPDYAQIKENVISILENMDINIIPLNSKSFVCRDSENPDALDLSKGFNIVVGGNTLGRGITFPNLQTVYYCRTAKTPQADTFWQHSRIFGYDRISGLIRMFMPESLYNMFVELNHANEILKTQIVNGTNKVELIYPRYIRPTRKHVVQQDALNMIYGCVNYFMREPINKHTKEIDDLIIKYSSLESVVVSKDIVIQALNLTDNNLESDFETNRFISCIEALVGKHDDTKFRLIVRIDRNISKGTGTVLSENDRKLGDKFENEVVLTMYRLNGQVEQGWEGKPLWLPNIKLPNNFCFYTI